MMIIRDSLIQKFHAFLRESGCTCVDDLNAIMDDIEAHATVNYDNATIDFTTQRVETELSYLGTLKVFTNNKSEDCEEQFTETVMYTVVSETSKTKVNGVLVSGGLVGGTGYEGVQGGAGETYQNQMQLAVQGVGRTETFDTTIFVPRETRVKVSIEKRIETFTCDVTDFVVTFSGKKSSIVCKCRKKDEKQAKNKMFQIEDIFESGPCGEDSHSHHHEKELSIRLNGKCTWSETSISLQCSNPEPLKISSEVTVTI